tara:strand:+ start:125 stop:406 length:282 start_codon:yes stop_codon:yes gene_type:complete
MPIQIEKTYTTTNSNTYLTADAFHAEHGPLGTENLNYILETGTSELVNNQSVKVTCKYADMAKYNEHAATTTGGIHAGKGGNVTAGSVTSTDI